MLGKKYVVSDVIMRLKRLYPNHHTRVQPVPNKSPLKPLSKVERLMMQRSGVIDTARPDTSIVKDYEAAVKPRIQKVLADTEWKTIDTGSLEDMYNRLTERIDEIERTATGGEGYEEHANPTQSD